MAPINILIRKKTHQNAHEIYVQSFVTISCHLISYTMGITYKFSVIKAAMKMLKQGLIAPLVFISDML